MRVLVVNHSPELHLGGSEISTLSLLREWRRRRPELEIHLVSPTERAAMARSARREGYTTHTVPFEGWVVFDVEGGAAQQRLRDLNAARATEQLIALVSELRPDLVITNTIVAPWGAVAASEAGVPHAWFVREFPDSSAGFHLVQGRVRTIEGMASLSELLIANSVAVRDDLVTVLGDRPIHVGYPPVESGRVAELAKAPLSEEPFLRPGALRIALVGRVTRAKGHWRAVEAIAELARRGHDAELIIVGEVVMLGHDAELRARARQLGIEENIRFLGEKVNPFPYLASAEVAVVPSDREAFGRVTLESMLLGVPPIVSAAGGSFELVLDGRTGALFDPDDPISLADALLPYAQDRERAAAQGVAAREHALSLVDGARGVGATIDALESVASAPKKPAAEAWRPAPVTATPAMQDRWRLQADLHRLMRRLLRLIRDPRPAVRRRWAILVSHRSARGSAARNP